MNERKIQKNFIDQIKGRKKVEKKSIGVYKYLVHHSFFEVLTNAYPEFYQIIQNKNLENEFNKSIYKFMQTKALCPYIWKMPNEYRKFLKKSRYFQNLQYVQDLLRFEYSELFIFMQKETKQKHTFKMSNKYKISKAITLDKYKYDVVNKLFDAPKELYLLGYFDNNVQEVVYRPLNSVLYSFLKSINKKLSLKNNLQKFLKKNKISYKKYAIEFQTAFEELYTQKVFL